LLITIITNKEEYARILRKLIVTSDFIVYSFGGKTFLLKGKNQDIREPGKPNVLGFFQKFNFYGFIGENGP
jgi:hypothetical protein